MGLDNIWNLPGDSNKDDYGHHPKFPHRLNISGGLCNGPGVSEGSTEFYCVSFRGKVYAEFISAISGHSLYEDVLSGEKLVDIIRGLKDLRSTLVSKTPREKMEYIKRKFFGDVEAYRVHSALEGLDDLILMFETYSAIKGAKLVSWY